MCQALEIATAPNQDPERHQLVMKANSEPLQSEPHVQFGNRTQCGLPFGLLKLHSFRGCGHTERMSVIGNSLGSAK